jgi:2-dehydro-3-deoxygluconokinase
MSRRIVCVGECMVELAPAGDGLYRRGFAGDTFNTAWYLRRKLPDDWTVAYGTCIGTDALSERMLAFVAASGIATDGIRRAPGRTVGLYMIDVEDGERSFTYWRSRSAARLLAADPAWLAALLRGADVVVLSGITLAVVEPQDRPALPEALSAARTGGATVVFDPNLRPALWPDAGTMRAEITRAAGIADLVLPSFEDESGAFGDADADATIARYRSAGAGTVVVKNGPGEVTAWDRAEGRAVLAPAPVAARDTTAAGDSFNAGFLAARLRGAGLAEAMGQGARLAGHVCLFPGALVPPEE